MSTQARPSGSISFAGIDLASDPKRTGVAVIREEHAGERLVVHHALLGADDDHIVKLVEESQKAGVDVPFGWPRPFVEHIASHAAGSVEVPKTTGPDWRRSMALRRTDMFVHSRLSLTPLSVSTDRIAYPAMRWSALEARLRVSGLDCSRDGTGRVCEVYPAAALKSWHLIHRRYKKTANATARDELVGQVEGRWPSLEWNGFRALAVQSDDVLDAIIAALVARESSQGRTIRPSREQQADAMVEGWIHLPNVD